MTKISHSAVYTYSTCARKYKLHYIDRMRSKVEHGALVFGRCLDIGLNHLLLTKNLEEAKSLFNKSFVYQDETYLPYSNSIVYSQRDFDNELLKDEDFTKYEEFKVKFKIDSTLSPKDALKHLLEIKKSHGFKELSDIEKRHYNFLNWTSLRRKGELMLTDYNKKIIPRIKQVLAVQKHISLENSEGDKITGICDLAVEWEDGKRYVLDNKTSGIKYEDDSAMRSQQLILYHHVLRDELKIDGGVGFLVLYKNILKNRRKICTVCMFDGSEGRFKTCNKEINGNRCGGEWKESIFPETDIDVILNPVSDAAEDLVISTFDEANNGIKAGIFNPNLNACKINAEMVCTYYNHCWKGDSSDLTKLESRNDRTVK